MTVVERGVLTDEARAELVALSKGKDVVGVVALRARIVLWWNEGRSAREIVSLSGMSEPTVRLGPERYEAEGVDGLFGKPHPPVLLRDGVDVEVGQAGRDGPATRPGRR